jgi:integrase
MQNGNEKNNINVLNNKSDVIIYKLSNNKYKTKKNIKKINEIWCYYSNNILKNQSKREFNTETGRWLNHLEPFLINCDIFNLKNEDVEKFKTYLFDKSLSPQTVKHCLSLLQRILKRAEENDIICIKKRLKFVMPKFDVKRYRFLSIEEAELLLNYLSNNNKKWFYLSAISLYTGLRKGEIFSLIMNDIDLFNSLIYVRQTKTRKNRVVPIPSGLKPIILQLIKEKKEEKKTGLIFENSTCLPFRNAIKELGLNDNITDRCHKVVFHSLRHTYASWLAQRNISMKIIGDLLGHSDLKMTNRYSHLNPFLYKNYIIDFPVLNYHE